MLMSRLSFSSSGSNENELDSFRQSRGIRSKDLVQLVYYSQHSESFDFSEYEMDNLLRISTERNGILNISGILIHTRNMFVQVLEGPAKSVRSVFESIARDKRHCAITVTSKFCQIPNRSFGTWAMAGISVDARDPARNLLAQRVLPPFGSPSNEALLSLMHYISDHR